VASGGLEHGLSGAQIQKAEALGGKRILGPACNEAGGVVVGHFNDPAGNKVGPIGLPGIE
jgi:predicted enzyme related to lactoylglutathione lyase